MAKLKPGDKIGPFPYQIVKQLGKGQGNMSDVYLATETDRPNASWVVLKISRASSQHGDFFTDTIHNEADRLQKLSHPGIVRLLPIRTSGASMRNVPHVANASLEGRPWFLILEHLSGESLDELLNKEKRIPQLLALRIAQRLAATLDYIHRCNQVHLDIKPENILFRRPLEADALPDPVLIDFGIARDVGQEGLEARTLHYAPPERVLLNKTNLPREALNLTKPAPSMDVYSLGIVLYQMLTGRRPFEGQNDKRISSAILQGNPTRPSTYVSDLDQEVEELVLQAMAREPMARPSAGELAQRLEAIAVRKAYSETPETVPTTARKRKVEKAEKADANAGGGRQRAGAWVAGGVTLAGLALVGTLAFAGGLPGLSNSGGPGGGSDSEAGAGPAGWWQQLLAFLPQAGSDGAGDEVTPIAWVTAAATATQASTPMVVLPTSTPVADRPTATDTQAPTSTAVRVNTATPTARAAIPPATSTPAVVAQAITTPATPTATPSPAPSPTPSRTPEPPTSTPIIRAGKTTAAPAKTVAVLTRPASTAVTGELSTPVPQHTPTPTPRPPAATPTSAATAAGSTTKSSNDSGDDSGDDSSQRSEPAATAAPLDFSQASVRLVSPVDGFSGSGAVTFSWETNYRLQGNQAFEPVFWRAGGDPMRDGRGYGGSTRGASVTINWDALGLAADGYQWGVMLVETDPYKRLHYMGGGLGFQFSPDGGGDNGDGATEGKSEDSGFKS